MLTRRVGAAEDLPSARIRQSFKAPDYDLNGFLLRLRPVSEDTITTKTAAVAMATIHLTQSTPALPFPPKAV